mmetsp:Transcript_1091/g.2075  ORF Transcript_1091/g.2075 Transcript_1091/m.2075 type:complete len:258 (-) Transcript_1091:260-1033(-)
MAVSSSFVFVFRQKASMAPLTSVGSSSSRFLSSSCASASSRSSCSFCFRTISLERMRRSSISCSSSESSSSSPTKSSAVPIVVVAFVFASSISTSESSSCSFSCFRRVARTRLVDAAATEAVAALVVIFVVDLDFECLEFSFLVLVLFLLGLAFVVAVVVALAPKKGLGGGWFGLVDDCSPSPAVLIVALVVAGSSVGILFVLVPGLGHRRGRFGSGVTQQRRLLDVAQRSIVVKPRGVGGAVGVAIFAVVVFRWYC